MCNRITLHNQVNEFIDGANWAFCDTSTKADLVHTFITEKALNLVVNSTQIAEAMKHQPYWCQGAGNFLDMAFSLDAALTLRDNTPEALDLTTAITRVQRKNIA